jgi:hypothetical protein
MTLRQGIIASLNFAHPAPVQLSGVPVLLVARHNATLAADALRHIEVEAVLFARVWAARRYQLSGHAGGRGVGSRRAVE